MSDKIKTVIADDEPHARERIRRLVQSEPDLKLVKELSNGRDTLEFIRENNPDLVFLDIQMPFLDGFEVICSLNDFAQPVFVFVTAYDKYAVKAFEISATDYLLKPFTDGRFRSALDRARAEISHRRDTTGSTNNDALLQSATDTSELFHRILVRSAGAMSIININDVEWLDVVGNYVALHYDGKSHLIRCSLRSALERLDQKVFVRIHRTTIVNARFIKSVSPSTGNFVEIQRGMRLPLSRRYYRQLKKMFRA
ncbi:MAG: response regulator transcription factor [candidate division Zixibacteria bacterium]|nr:response regulator transcription factor [candidate division Zixibacteria bacterium]